MELDALFDLWQSAREAGDYEQADKYITVARLHISSAGNAGWNWLADSLRNEERKWFVAEIFEAHPVPRKLYERMILTGVLEKDPSSNRYFIEPCVRSFGSRDVLSELLNYLRSGMDEQRAGAASALYWVSCENKTDLDDPLRNQIRCQMLSEFVRNDNIEVRRRIIPMLALDPEIYPESLQSLIPEAISIARAHPDEYIRHRVEVQLGAGRLFMAIPTAKNA